MDKVENGDTAHHNISSGTTGTSTTAPQAPCAKPVAICTNRLQQQQDNGPLPRPQPSYNSGLANVPMSPPPQPSYNSGMANVPMSPPPQPSYNNGMANVPMSPQPSYNNGMIINTMSHPLYNANGAPFQSTAYGTYYNANILPVINNRQFNSYSEKSVVETYLLAVSPLGVLGAHHFYLQRYIWGILYFFTLGLAGFGYLIDWFRVPCLVKQANNKMKNPEEDQKTISDAYTLWFPMGLLGFHHYYLGNYAWGVVYTCTLGLFGVGWIVDAFRIPALVRSANGRDHLHEMEEKSVCVTAALGISPLGVLGAHHFYLNRPVWGAVYILTFGLLGVGWVADWFRISVLVKRANKSVTEGRSNNAKTIDDAYILWFPFGLLGFHQFYLGRPLWGLLYFFTLGIAGFGWLIDMCRMPCLVSKANLRIEAEQEQRKLVSGQISNTSAASTSGTSSAQGHYNYTMANQGGIMPMHPAWHYFHRGAFDYNYQQGRYSGQQTSQTEPNQNFVCNPSTYYPIVYNNGMGGPQILSPVNDFAPPPYQLAEPSHNNHQTEEIPTKE